MSVRTSTEVDTCQNKRSTLAAYLEEGDYVHEFSHTKESEQDRTYLVIDNRPARKREPVARRVALGNALRRRCFGGGISLGLEGCVGAGSWWRNGIDTSGKVRPFVRLYFCPPGGNDPWWRFNECSEKGMLALRGSVDALSDSTCGLLLHGSEMGHEDGRFDELLRRVWALIIPTLSAMGWGGCAGVYVSWRCSKESWR
ncbi:hypothetical protein FA13DRAFT_1709952 [Coprinellus micaceus]|uniref:Uncharacterized protein n=1 Tax=Coprinellus micaceus TaxID=71717 RepID=A0A4Y7TAF2_COPMI|nr:hypothetical protein FA13DRAFT_1709952 [Coprinellus micaceus]